MTVNDITTKTPSEIDAELDRLSVEHAKATRVVNGLTDRLARLLDDGMTEYASDLERRIDQARKTVAKCMDAAAPLDGEFTRRGGWTRAWLVLNTGGHVHRTTECRTCFPSTQFAWLTQLSGQDEAKIVEQAGESACTECYPSAPTDVRSRPSQIKTPEQLARLAEKAERAKVKAAKAITAPDGTPLYTNNYGRIDTEFTARRSYVDAEAYAQYLTRVGPTVNVDTIAAYRSDAQRILAALAAKHDRTDEDLRNELAPRIQDLRRRKYR